MTQSLLIGEPVEHWMTQVLEKRGAAPTVVFCVSVAHIQMFCARYCAEGVKAVHLDGDTPAYERRQGLEDLRAGRIHVICNCGLISEGLDVPDISVMQLLRPTKSVALFLQMCGRGSRPHAEGRASILLDHVGNVWRHGRPNQQRRWTLDRAARDTAAASFKTCHQCHAVVALSARRCLQCGAVLIAEEKEPTGRTPPERPGQLRHLEDELPFDLGTADFKRSVDWCGGEALRLGYMCVKRGYEWGWLWHRLEEIGQQRNYWRIRRFLAEGDGYEGSATGAG